MTSRRKLRKIERGRLSRIAAENRRINGVEIPRAAVLADVSKQVPNNSYSPPPLFYVDYEFKCRDCGRQEVWTAAQQKWYYEVAKGSLFSYAIRCRECRNKIVDQKLDQRGQMEDAKLGKTDG